MEPKHFGDNQVNNINTKTAGLQVKEQAELVLKQPLAACIVNHSHLTRSSPQSSPRIHL